MPDKSQKKEETKKLIRSILATTPVKLGVKLSDFLKDYREFAGSSLPSRDLGYNNDQDFLIDIPDVVHVSQEGRETILRCVADESMQHVMNLVNNQKISASQKKKRYRPSRRTFGGPPPPAARYGHPQRRGAASFQNYQSELPHHTVPRNRSAYELDETHERPLTKPMVKPFLQHQILEVCLSFSSGLHCSQFAQAMSRRYNTTLNYTKMGFSSLLELFESLDNIIEIKHMRDGGYWVYARKDATPGAGKLCDEPRQTGMTGIAAGETKESSSRLSKENLKQDVKAVLAANPDGVWASFFRDEYKKCIGHDLPLQRLGYTTVIELLGTMTDVVRIDRPNDKDWLLRAHDAVTKPSERSSVIRAGGDGQPRPQTQLGRAAGRGRGKPGAAAAAAKVAGPPGLRRPYNTAPVVSAEVRERLRQVLQNNPDGLSQLELPGVHQDQSGYDLDHMALGYSTLESLILQLSDVVEVRYINRSHRLFAVDNGLPPQTNLLLPHPTYTAAAPVPEDAVGPGCVYRSIQVQADMDNFLNVYVSNVISLANFCIQLIGRESTEALENLMDRLEHTYCGYEGDCYTIPVHMVKVGQVCAAVFPEDNNWHRCVVTAIQDEAFVEVFYVDYGSTQVVPMSSLKFLRNQYLQLPAQAIKAKLANLTPTKKGEKQGQKKLLSLVMDKSLFAMVTSRDKDDVVSVCLCDTSHGEDLWINDLLCQEEYAKFEEQVAPPPPSVDAPPVTPSTSHTVEDLDESMSAMTVRTPPRTPPPAEQEEEEEEEIYQSDDEEEEEEEEEEPGCRRYLKYVTLTDKYSAHIINFDGFPWLLSAEISAFFWGKDLLRSQLRQRQISFNKEVLMKDEYPEIFQEFLDYEVKGCLEEKSAAEKDQVTVKAHVTIYQLKEVVQIVEQFRHPSEELLAALKKACKTFNPDDPFWKGAEEEDEDMAEAARQLTVRELETAQDTLQMMRKRIFRDMTLDPARIREYVDQLNVTDQKLISVRHQLKDAKTQQDMKLSKLTQEEDFTLQCVEEQYKAAAAAAAAFTFTPHPAATHNMHMETRSVQLPTAEASSPSRKTNAVAPMPPKPVEGPLSAMSITSSAPDKTYSSSTHAFAAPSHPEAPSSAAAAALPAFSSSSTALQPLSNAQQEQFLFQQFEANLFSHQQQQQQEAAAASAASINQFPPPPPMQAAAGSMLQHNPVQQQQQQQQRGGGAGRGTSFLPPAMFPPPPLESAPPPAPLSFPPPPTQTAFLHPQMLPMSQASWGPAGPVPMAANGPMIGRFPGMSGSMLEGVPMFMQGGGVPVSMQGGMPVSMPGPMQGGVPGSMPGPMQGVPGSIPGPMPGGLVPGFMAGGGGVPGPMQGGVPGSIQGGMPNTMQNCFTRQGGGLGRGMYYPQ